jgi:CDP-diacylglycerol--glycerol-3-phosphate 3-phosphatidyltransferase
LAPVVAAFWLSASSSLRWWGLGVFVVAGFTDLFDGIVARHTKHTTQFGAYLDPLADKILVLGTGLALVSAHRLAVWILFLILIRELAVTGLRSILPRDQYMPASYAAKWKTTVQLIALGASSVLVGMIPDIFWALALALTLWTGFEYFYQHWPR